MRGIATLLSLALLLGGCAPLRGLPRSGYDADETRQFLLRLAEADRAELERIGAALEAPTDGPVRSRQALRHALWQSTPGHPGFAAGPARSTLHALVSEGRGLDPDTRDLLRVYLAQLDRLIELRRANRDLTAANRELRRQIEDLTRLEGVMDGGAIDGE